MSAPFGWLMKHTLRKPGMLAAIALGTSVCCAPSLPAAEPASAGNASAPYQFGRRSYFPAGSDMYSQQVPGDVFRKQAFPAPEFLPPEAWEPEGRPRDAVEPAQYPYADTVPRDGAPNLLPQQSPQQTIIEEQTSGWEWASSSISATVIPGPDEEFGWTSFDLVARGGFRQTPWLQFLPRFSAHLLEGPTVTDLPPRLYDFALDTLVFLPLGERWSSLDRWSFLGMVGPAMFTDFENTSDSLRVTGRALVFYEWSDTVKLSGGFLYLDRDDVRAIPAGGVTYTPSEDFKAEILFPKPKIAWRTRCEEDFQRWWYVAGEFGGNSWAIRRANGTDDVISIRDLRLLVGLETAYTQGARHMLEAGFVFDRKLEYRSGIGDTDQNPTGLIRYVIAQ